MEKEHKVCMRDLNPHIVCILCAGYFIDATTITECLHTFCKSCIVKFFQTSKHCPMCNVKVHETQPLLNLKPDRALQDIVYKVVPGLWESEKRRREEFEKTRSWLKYRKEPEIEMPEETEDSSLCTKHYFIHDELIQMRIEPVRVGPFVKEFKRPPMPKFVRCSIRALVYHVKKLIQKVWLNTDNYEVDVMCNGDVIPANYCLKRLWLTYGREMNAPRRRKIEQLNEVLWQLQGNSCRPKSSPLPVQFTLRPRE